MNSELRVPQMTREKTSSPVVSTPNGWSRLGPGLERRPAGDAVRDRVGDRQDRARGRARADEQREPDDGEPGAEAEALPLALGFADLGAGRSTAAIWSVEASAAGARTVSSSTRMDSRRGYAVARACRIRGSRTE